MRSALAKLKLSHLVLAALLVATLWFPSAREAHSLCFRLLLHLKGDTFVQGQPPGCVIRTIPNVQFSQQHIQELRAHSKDSLDAYALAVCTGNESMLEAPKLTPACTNHPLLVWAALQLAKISDWQQDTNKPDALKLQQTTFESARRAIRLAQSVEPTNGALWLAEACLNFSEHQDDDALLTLQMAASNSWWSARSGMAFTNLAGLCQTAGLSELDAVIQANWGRADDSALVLQGYCSRNLTRLFTKAIKDNDKVMLSMLLKKFTDLRRAEWEDKSVMVFNSISLRDYSDDLIIVMTAKLGRPAIPTNDTVAYQKVKELKQESFNDFFNQLPDQRLASIYLTQNEKIHYEKRLRSQIRNRNFPQTLYWSAFTDITAAFASAALSLIPICVLLELLIWKLDLRQRDLRPLLQRPRFRLGVFVVSVCLALVMTNWSVCLGVNAEVGLRMGDEPMPLLPPDLRDFLIWLSIPFVILLLAYFMPAKYFKDANLKPGYLTMVTIGAYLSFILMMAFCRHWLAGLVSSQYL